MRLRDRSVRQTGSPRVKPLPNGRGSDAMFQSVHEAVGATTVREWLLFRRTAILRQLLALFVLFSCAAGAAELPYFSVLSEDAGAWPAILASVGLERQPAGVSRIFVARTGAAASVEWPARVERGAILILEGESSLADLF